MRTFVRFALVALVGMTLAGCATVVCGANEDISFTSDPSGADVVIDGAPKGKTPAVIPVHRSWDPVMVEFRMDGHQSVTVQMETELEEVTLVNIIFPIGFAVDYVSDAMHQFKEKEVHATLPKK